MILAGLNHIQQVATCNKWHDANFILMKA